MHSSVMSNYAARVEELAANPVKANSQKASGPLAKAIMPMLMPIALKTFFNPAKMFGANTTIGSTGMPGRWRGRVEIPAVILMHESCLGGNKK